MNSMNFFKNQKLSCPFTISQLPSLDSSKEMFKVLHLDDDAEILEICKSILERYGDILVDSIEYPDLALEKVQSNSYDAIITDYQMPIMSGLEFVDKIRSFGVQIPIVVLSAIPDQISSLSYSNLIVISKGEPPELLFQKICGVIRSKCSKFLPIQPQLHETLRIISNHELKSKNLLSDLNIHDLRNQINIQMNILDFLIERHQDDPDLIIYLTEVLQSSQKIVSIIDCTDRESLSVKARPQWIDVYDLFQPAVREAEEHGIITHIEDNNMEILSFSYLNKIFPIFIDNSIRHGKKVTTIQMSVESSDRGLLLLYEDNGVGIPTNDKEKIFLNHYGENTGEGLYYAYSLLSLLGITIREIGKYGRGVKFEMLIPANHYRKRL